MSGDPGQERARISRGFWVVVVLLAFGLGVIVLYMKWANTPIRANPPAATERFEEPSEADQWARKVRADLDQTTLEQFVIQMPEGPKMWREGVNRYFEWTFSDGSTIKATFRPTERPGGGLILYMVEID